MPYSTARLGLRVRCSYAVLVRRFELCCTGEDTYGVSSDDVRGG